MKNFSKLVVSITICELVGLISIPFTISSIATWYVFLHKPSFFPPNWVFGPVWTTLYLLMGVSAYLVWKRGLRNEKVKSALLYFLLQLILNFLWSLFFFGFHFPLLGFIDIIALIAIILVTMRKFCKVSKIAMYLLVPYVVWVSFASILNLAIVLLNK